MALGRSRGAHRARATDRYSWRGGTAGMSEANAHREVTGRQKWQAGSHRQKRKGGEKAT